MSRKAIIPMKMIPQYCRFCGSKISDEERNRQTHPFLCSNPNLAKPHEIFVSPLPTAVHMLFVRQEDGRLAVSLGKRANPNEPGYDKWALPGGFTEGETGLQASPAEFMEELGVDISDVPIRHVDEYYDPKYHCLNHFYAGLWPHAEPPPLQPTDECSEVWICPVDELPELAFPTQADIIRRVAPQFAA